jgi:Glyoxalase-like domain
MYWIHAMIDVPPDLADVSGDFWSHALGWPLGRPWTGHPEFRSFEPAGGDAYVHQQVGDHRPRLHLDIEVVDTAVEARRLAGLGAEVGPAFPDWQPMSSPGGLPFCLTRGWPRDRPDPLAWPGGHRTRLAQVAIDSPRDRHQTEVAFWRAATGWRWTPGDADEFAGKLDGRPGTPIRLLLQRLDSDAPATRAHIDLGTDDIEADAVRLEGFGAERLHPGGGWITLRDPAGMIFCTTGNSPD